MTDQKRVATFIDASNLHHAQKVNGWQIDYEKLAAYLDALGKSVGRYYFTPSPAYHDTRAVEGYRRFKKALIFMGYTVKDKELKEVKAKDPATGRIVIRPKADLDTEISDWMDKVYRDYHIAVVMGGDSDLVPAIERMVTDGK